MIRVFVNGAAVDVAPGAAALDAVRAWRPDAADDLAAGRQQLTDSRGLPIPPSSPMSAGSILRLVPVRDRTAPAEEPS